ncbi:MAG: DUF58 domain-containing protein, partial [Lacisediminimonas sp.]|nr:DUF58 domain-containing protein [Lacisediminimonas sp.]
RRFAAAARYREAALRLALAEAGVDTLELSTDDVLMEAIQRFAALRKLRASQCTASRAMPRHLEH